MLIRLCSVINCMVKLIFNEQGNNETSGWVYWVPKKTASQWEAGWRITGHLHLPPNIFLLLSKGNTYYCHHQKNWNPSIPVLGHFSSQNTLSAGLCLKWEPLTWGPKSTFPITRSGGSQETGKCWSYTQFSLSLFGLCNQDLFIEAYISPS